MTHMQDMDSANSSALPAWGWCFQIHIPSQDHLSLSKATVDKLQECWPLLVVCWVIITNLTKVCCNTSKTNCTEAVFQIELLPQAVFLIMIFLFKVKQCYSVMVYNLYHHLPYDNWWSDFSFWEWHCLKHCHCHSTVVFCSTKKLYEHGAVFTRDSIYAIRVYAMAILSVRLSHGWISQKHLKLGLCSFYLQ